MRTELVSDALQMALAPRIHAELVLAAGERILHGHEQRAQELQLHGWRQSGRDAEVATVAAAWFACARKTWSALASRNESSARSRMTRARGRCSAVSSSSRAGAVARSTSPDTRARAAIDVLGHADAKHGVDGHH